MNLLAVDTASQSCSVALLQKGQLRCEMTVNAGDTHSRRVLTLIDSVLRIAGITAKSIDGYAVTIGPGSFTGLRIGLSVVKGMALAVGKPIVGVSSLDALAYPCRSPHLPVCVLMDARRKEVYSAFFEPVDGGMAMVGDAAVLSPEDAISGITGPCAFVGSGALLYRDLIFAEKGGAAFFPSSGEHLIKASSVAFLALKQWASASAEPDIQPIYLRPSDAEVNRKQNLR